MSALNTRFALGTCAVELEKKCAELEAVQRQAHVPEQAQQQPAAEHAQSAGAAAAGPTQEQQLEWRLARLKQQVESAKSKLANREAELSAAHQQAAQHEAELKQRLREAEAGRANLEQQLRQQARELAAAQQEAALLRARQAVAGKALPSKATAPPAPDAGQAGQAGSAGVPVAGAQTQLVEMLHLLKHELVAGLRSELQLHLGPLSAALAQQGLPPLPGGSQPPSGQQAQDMGLALLSPVPPGAASTPAAPLLAPSPRADSLPGTWARQPSPPSSAVDTQRSEGGAGRAPVPMLLPVLPAGQEEEAPTPRLAALLPPAAQQRKSSRFSPAGPAALPPPLPSQQHGDARHPAPPAGSPTPAVAAAIAAAQALAAKVAAEQLALRAREKESQNEAQVHAARLAQEVAGKGLPAAAMQSSGRGQQLPAVPQEQQQEQRRHPAASASPTHDQAQLQQAPPRQAGLDTEAVGELPPWLALAASIRTKQLEAAAAKSVAALAPAHVEPGAGAPSAHATAAATAAAAMAAEPEFLASKEAAAEDAAPTVQALTQLEQWQQIASAYPDNEDGLPPGSLPFSVPGGKSAWAWGTAAARQPPAPAATIVTRRRHPLARGLRHTAASVAACKRLHFANGVLLVAPANEPWRAYRYPVQGPRLRRLCDSSARGGSRTAARPAG